MTKKLTPAIVRGALDARYGKDVVRFYRSRSGYYYFMSNNGVARWNGEIPSLYWYNLDGVKLSDILDHVAEYVNPVESG